MYVVFTYSLIEEIKNLLDLFINQKENKNLRSVVYPSLRSVTNSLLPQTEIIRECSDIWNRVEPEFNKALVEAGLIPIKSDVVCFIHLFGCEGWFNVGKNQIHIRTTQSSKENTVDSIMHELLHLITYKPNMSYEEREVLVEKYMILQPFQKLLM